MSTLASVIIRDVIASRPAAAIAGRLFFASDTGDVFRDSGAAWVTITGAPASIVLRDVIGSRPAAAIPGRLFFASDTGNCYRDNGATWDAVTAGGGSSLPNYLISGTTAPLAAAFTLVNQSTSSITDTATGLCMVQPDSATQYIFAALQNAPATPWTLTVALIPGIAGVAYCGIGLVFSDGTKFSEIEYQWNGGPTFASNSWNAYNSFSGAYTSIPGPPCFGPLLWLRLTDDGVNRAYWWSHDGVSFQKLHQVGRTDFLTPSQFGLMCKAQNGSGGKAVLTCADWVVT